MKWRRLPLAALTLFLMGFFAAADAKEGADKSSDPFLATDAKSKRVNTDIKPRDHSSSRGETPDFKWGGFYGGGNIGGASGR